MWAFVAFILLTLAIAVYKGGAAGSSVITGADPKELQAPAKPTPAPAVPPAAARTLPVQPAPAPATRPSVPSQSPAPQ